MRRDMHFGKDQIPVHARHWSVERCHAGGSHGFVTPGRGSGWVERCGEWKRAVVDGWLSGDYF